MDKARKADIKSTDDRKSPAKPISLYPMSEEEALQRLLRVPPPVKMRGERNMGSIAQAIGDKVVTNAPANRATSIGASMTITAVAADMKVTSVVVRENGKVVSAKSS